MGAFIHIHCSNVMLRQALDILNEYLEMSFSKNILEEQFPLRKSGFKWLATESHEDFQAIWVIKLWIIIIHTFILRLSFSTSTGVLLPCHGLHLYWELHHCWLMFCVASLVTVSFSVVLPRMRNQDGAIIGEVFGNHFWSLRVWWREQWLGELLCVSVPLTKECWLFQFAPDRLILPPNVFSRLLEVWHDWRG